MIDLVLDQAKSGLKNSNLPRPHDHKQEPSPQSNFTYLETSKLQVEQEALNIVSPKLIEGTNLNTF